MWYRIILLLLLIGIICFLGNTSFAQPNEATCKNQVNASIAAIDMVEQQTGQEKSLNGLTKKEINEMLKTMTNCEVMQEINKRTHK
jgi:hypothetical protein